MTGQTAHSETFVTRHAESRIRVALTDTRIVAIVGPRQSGKTTLARRIADSDGRPFSRVEGVVAEPLPPQSRTCAANASGSSHDSFAQGWAASRRT